MNQLVTHIEDMRDPRLTAIIDQLQQMRPDMHQLSRGITRCIVLDHIDHANLAECKSMIDQLSDRVSDLVGTGCGLDDAASELQDCIDAEACADDPTCPVCHGDNQMHVCHFCNGSGRVNQDEVH